jgi:hypothetical protein
MKYDLSLDFRVPGANFSHSWLEEYLRKQDCSARVIRTGNPGEFVVAYTSLEAPSATAAREDSILLVQTCIRGARCLSPDAVPRPVDQPEAWSGQELG